MDGIYRLIVESPADRLALIISVFIIGILCAAIIGLWRREAALQKELKEFSEKVWELLKVLINERRS